jgi:hypothetical protein
MTVKKGDRLKTSYSNETFEAVGKWLGDYVFAPVGSDQQECLIYSAGDVEELLETGKFVREERRAK